MRFVLIALFALALPVPALAHVTANPNEGVAGKYFETKFRISHGCEGSDTLSVVVTLPKGTVIAKPQYKQGWIIEVKKSPLEKPVPTGHGKMADEQIDEIIWSGNVLPDGNYDEFGILTKLPEAAGETLWFPVKQICKEGAHDWKEIPAQGQGWHELKSPAPFVKILPGANTEHKH